MKKQLRSILSTVLILFKYTNLTNLWSNIFSIISRKSEVILYSAIITVSLIVAPSFLTFLPSGVNYGPTLNAQQAPLTFNIRTDIKEVVISRVSLKSVADTVTVISPVPSLIIYNTATAGVFPDNVVPGFYYWNKKKWVDLGNSFNDFYFVMPSNISTDTEPNLSHKGPVGSSTHLKIDSSILPPPSANVISRQVRISNTGQLIMQIKSTENPVGNASKPK